MHVPWRSVLFRIARFGRWKKAFHKWNLISFPYDFLKTFFQRFSYSFVLVERRYMKANYIGLWLTQTEPNLIHFPCDGALAMHLSISSRHIFKITLGCQSTIESTLAVQTSSYTKNSLKQKSPAEWKTRQIGLEEKNRFELAFTQSNAWNPFEK